MALSIINQYLFLSSILGLFLFIILLIKKDNLLPKLFLSICLLCLSLTCLFNFATTTVKLEGYPNVSATIKTLIFLILPSAYLYIKHSFSQVRKTEWRDFVHFIPFVLFQFFTLGGHLFGANEVLFFGILEPDKMILYAVWLFYLGAQTLLLLKSGNTSGYFTFCTDKICWLKMFNGLLILLFVCELVSDTANEVPTVSVMAFIIISTACWLFLKPKVFLDTESELGPETAAQANENTESPVPSLLITKMKCKQYLVELDRVLEQEKPFLKKRFAIRDLSELTQIPIHHLSFLINKEYDMHFQDFINMKRIDYLKSIINNDQVDHLSLEGMAWAVGFTSRTTFFRAFMKLTKQSPSDYFRLEKQKNAKYVNTA